MSSLSTRDARLLPGCSSDHAVDNSVDGEAEPLVAIAGDHLCGVGGDQREPLGRYAGKSLVELVDLLLVAVVVAAAARAPHIALTGGGRHQQHEDVASPGGVLGVKPAAEQDPQQVLSQEQDRFGRGWTGTLFV
jgi:hypothetical protein